MTAPAIAPAPTAPVAAPAPVVEQQQPTSPVDAAVQALTPPTPQEPAIAETDTLESRINRVGRKVSEHGKAFAEQLPTVGTHPAEQGVPKPLDAPTSEAPAVEAAPVADATPPRMVPVIEVDDVDGKMALRARDPETGQFSEMDRSKVFEMRLKDPSTGEERIYQPNLEELMRGFKRGVRMQQAEPELQYYRENTPKWGEQHAEMETRMSSAEQRAQQYEALAISLLTEAEDRVVQMREDYARQFTPESENQRLRAELARLQNTRTPAPQATPPAPVESQQVNPQLAAAFKSRTAPVMAEVQGLVGEAAAIGKLARFTLPLLVNGKIPPERYQEVEAYIVGPYRQWAQSEAANKTSTQQQIQKELDAARATQQRAQQAVNAIGSATRPLGGIPSNAPVQLPPPRNREELIQRISRGRPQTQMAG